MVSRSRFGELAAWGCGGAIRVVEISGAVGLSLGYERRQSMIRRADDSTLVWTSASGGLLSLDVDLREAAVICMLVVNSVQQSSSMLRFLHFL